MIIFRLFSEAGGKYNIHDFIKTDEDVVGILCPTCSFNKQYPVRHMKGVRCVQEPDRVNTDTLRLFSRVNKKRVNKNIDTQEIILFKDIARPDKERLTGSVQLTKTAKYQSKTTRSFSMPD